MFDRHRQPWQCSIITYCGGGGGGGGGGTVMVLPASCPFSVVVIIGNCRHKIKVMEIPLGWGGAVVTND